MPWLGSGGAVAGCSRAAEQGVREPQTQRSGTGACSCGRNSSGRCQTNGAATGSWIDASMQPRVSGRPGTPVRIPRVCQQLLRDAAALHHVSCRRVGQCTQVSVKTRLAPETAANPGTLSMGAAASGAAAPQKWRAPVAPASDKQLGASWRGQQGWFQARSEACAAGCTLTRRQAHGVAHHTPQQRVLKLLCSGGRTCMGWGGVGGWKGVVAATIAAGDD